MAGWIPGEQPPRWVVWLHRIIGPPAAAFLACLDAFAEARHEWKATYRSVRSCHADKWSAEW